MERKIEKLEKKIEYLVTVLAEMHRKEDKVVHYHINHLEIQSAQIEKLDYHLDSIGIEQLSGTLNIGNNFNSEKKADPTNTTDPISSLTTKKESTTKPAPIYRSRINYTKNNHPAESGQLKITERKRGFSITLNQKEENE